MEKTSIRVQNKLYELRSMGIPTTVVRVRNIPVDVSDEEICQYFEAYGRIIEIKHWKQRVTHCRYMDGTYNGDRILIMYRERDIPRSLNYKYTELNVSYRGQPIPCNYCKSLEHIVVQCLKLLCAVCLTRGHNTLKCPNAIFCDKCEERHIADSWPLELESQRHKSFEMEVGGDMALNDDVQDKQAGNAESRQHLVDVLNADLGEFEWPMKYKDRGPGNGDLHLDVPINKANLATDAIVTQFRTENYPGMSLEIITTRNSDCVAQGDDPSEISMANKGTVHIEARIRSPDSSRLDQSQDETVNAQSAENPKPLLVVQAEILKENEQCLTLKEWETDPEKEKEWEQTSTSPEICPNSSNHYESGDDEASSSSYNRHMQSIKEGINITSDSSAESTEVLLDKTFRNTEERETEHFFSLEEVNTNTTVVPRHSSPIPTYADKVKVSPQFNTNQLTPAKKEFRQTRLNKKNRSSPLQTPTKQQKRERSETFSPSDQISPSKRESPEEKRQKEQNSVEELTNFEKITPPPEQLLKDSE